MSALLRSNGAVAGLVLVLCLFSVSSTHFLTYDNLVTILLQVAVYGIVTMPNAFLIVSGRIDLSVGSVSVLAAVIFGQVYHATHSIPVAIVAAMATGTAWGAANGFLTSYAGFSPIIVTLGGLAAARGLAEVISQGTSQFSFGSSFATLGNGALFGIRLPVYIFLGLLIVAFYLWYMTPVGVYAKAIGASPETAHEMGLPEQTLPFLMYVASGFLAAGSGLIVTSELDAASVTIGQNLELIVLTAVLIGGISFLGGRGSLIGVIAGVLFLGVLQDGLVVTDVGAFWQPVAVGFALLIAAGLDVVEQRYESRAMSAVPVDGQDSDGEASGAVQMPRRSPWKVVSR